MPKCPLLCEQENGDCYIESDASCSTISKRCGTARSYTGRVIDPNRVLLFFLPQRHSEPSLESKVTYYQNGKKQDIGGRRSNQLSYSSPGESTECLSTGVRYFMCGSTTASVGSLDDEDEADSDLRHTQSQTGKYEGYHSFCQHTGHCKSR